MKKLLFYNVLVISLFIHCNCSSKVNDLDDYSQEKVATELADSTNLSFYRSKKILEAIVNDFKKQPFAYNSSALFSTRNLQMVHFVRKYASTLSAHDRVYGDLLLCMAYWRYINSTVNNYSPEVLNEYYSLLIRIPIDYHLTQEQRGILCLYSSLYNYKPRRDINLFFLNECMQNMHACQNDMGELTAINFSLSILHRMEEEGKINNKQTYEYALQLIDEYYRIIDRSKITGFRRNRHQSFEIAIYTKLKKIDKVKELVRQLPSGNLPYFKALWNVGDYKALISGFDAFQKGNHQWSEHTHLLVSQYVVSSYDKLGEFKQANQLRREITPIIIENIKSKKIKFSRLDFDFICDQLNYYIHSGEYSKAQELLNVIFNQYQEMGYIACTNNEIRLCKEITFNSEAGPNTQKDKLRLLPYLMAFQQEINLYNNKPDSIYSTLVAMNDFMLSSPFIFVPANASEISFPDERFMFSEIQRRMIDNIKEKRSFDWLIWCSALIFSLFVYFIFIYILRRSQHLKSEIMNESQQEPVQTPPLSQHSALFDRIQEKIITSKAFLNPDIRIQDIALAIGSNKTYVSASINNHTGKNVNAWINSLRIKYCLQFLDEKGVDSKDLFIQCGFASKSTFYKTFREYTGLTPKEYINHLHNEQTLSEDLED